MRTGFLLGGVIFVNFSPILGLQFEPAYVQKGASLEQSETIEGYTVAIEGAFTADYLDIPVLLKVSLGDGPVKPYLVGGATIALLLGDGMLEIDKATINGQDVTSMIPSDEREEKVEVKSTDFIFDVGGGLTIPLGQVDLFIEAQYNIGLTNINDDPDDETEIKTTGIQVKAGVMFPIK